jgi:uncharacterized protein DUF6627
MKAFLLRFICRLLAVSLGALPYAPQTQAGMIGVDEALAAQRQAERGKLQGFLARADVQKQLAVLGVGPAAAAERANALTDDEVQQLAGRIDSLPAGAEISTAGLLLVLIVILLIFMFRR